ncbi:MAG TPA: hydroxymethylbilane synthase [Vicinamibacterales bacterium]|nr:hydroxymethylbilane synthase [Vicinamibacterales bacterium]
MTLRIGTRGSELALFQADAVAAQLRAKTGLACETVVIRTSGDKLADASLAQIGGKRLFVKEIEDALLDGDIDLAVHSSKDMPVVLPEGLRIAGVLPREDARDAVVLPAEGGQVRLKAAPTAQWGPASAGPSALSVEELVSRLGSAPRIGTSSVRRTAQLARVFAGASFLPIRGNLGTRLRKLDAGEYDALVLASAGLIRLQQQARISASLPIAACVPAPGQGIIAVEIRANDDRVAAAVAAIDDAHARGALDAERAAVVKLGGGCQMPIGAHATVAGGSLTLTAIVLSLDGTRAVRAESRGAVHEAAGVGTAVAEDLLSRGAAEILAEVQQAHAAVEGIQP